MLQEKTKRQDEQTGTVERSRRRQSGIQLRRAVCADELQAGDNERNEAPELEKHLGLSALLDAYEAAGYGVSVGAACALGTQLCDALHRLHHASQASGELQVHGRVAFDTVFVSLAGELMLTGLGSARPDPRGRAVDVRDAAVLITELLGGQAAALKLLPVELGGVVERALRGAAPGERPVRAADLARALATEAARPGELHIELRLVWPRFSAPVRLPLPPRVPSQVPGILVDFSAWEDPRDSSAPETIPARPSATHRQVG